MAESEKNESTSSSLDGAMRVGADAARGARAASKAAAQAAAGNVAGAAVTVAKDGQLLSLAAKAAIVFTAFFLVLVIFFLYALPTMLFEAVDSYFDSISSEWEASYYESLEKHQEFVSGVIATFKTATTVGKDFWNKFKEGMKKLFETSDDEEGAQTDDTYDTFSDDASELLVTQDEDKEKSTLKNKMTACEGKLNKRLDQITEAVQDADTQKQYKKLLEEKYGGQYDEIIVNTSVTSSAVSPNEALKVMSMMTVMKGGASLSDIKVTSLMKWLGSYDHSLLGWGNKKEYEIGDTGVKVKVSNWKGTFLPQYLEDEKQTEGLTDKQAQNDDRFKDKMCAATDVLIRVDSPKIDDIQITKNVVQNDDGSTTVEGVANINIDIGIRSEEELKQIAGIWEGSLAGNGKSGGREHPDLITDSLGGSSASAGTSDASAGTYSGGTFAWPCPASHKISSGFGPRNISVGSKYHKGIDIACPVGSSVCAAADGTVTVAGSASGYGTAVYIKHDGGIVTRYGHLSQVKVKVNQQVKKGEVIALSGNTGVSTGPHLHFEIRENDKAVNPSKYVGS